MLVKNRQFFPRKGVPVFFKTTILIILLYFLRLATSEQTANIGKWVNCTQSQFIYKLKSTNFNIYKSSKIPTPLGCDHITIPQQTKVYSKLRIEDTFQTNEFRYGGVKNLCDANKKLESTFNCLDLCLDNGMTTFNVSVSSIYEWINYCQYCRNANGYERYHEFRLQNVCNNTKNVAESQPILELIHSFPTDIRYCGTVNIGLPVLVGPLFDSYAIVCYCEQNNRFEFECMKHGWENILKTGLDISGSIVSCLLFILVVSVLLIPKVANFVKRTPGFSFLRLMPSISLVFSSLCYIVNFALFFTSWYALSSTFIMMAELMLYYSLFPIVMRWYGMSSLINQQQGGTNHYSVKKVYIVAIILFLLAAFFVCFMTIIMPLYIIGDQYFVYTYISIFWFVEVLCLSMFVITSKRVNSVLSRFSDVTSHSVPFSKLTYFSIGFIVVLSLVDLHSLFAKLSDDRAFFAYTEVLTDFLYCILFCRIIIFEFDSGDFKVFNKKPTEMTNKIESIVETQGHEVPSSNSSYHLLDEEK